jgi:hypothetical protein
VESKIKWDFKEVIKDFVIEETILKFKEKDMVIDSWVNKDQEILWEEIMLTGLVVQMNYKELDHIKTDKVEEG